MVAALDAHMALICAKVFRQMKKMQSSVVLAELHVCDAEITGRLAFHNRFGVLPNETVR